MSGLGNPNSSGSTLGSGESGVFLNALCERSQRDGTESIGKRMVCFRKHRLDFRFRVRRDRVYVEGLGLSKG